MGILLCCMKDRFDIGTPDDDLKIEYYSSIAIENKVLKFIATGDKNLGLSAWVQENNIHGRRYEQAHVMATKGTATLMCTFTCALGNSSADSACVSVMSQLQENANGLEMFGVGEKLDAVIQRAVNTDGSDDVQQLLDELERTDDKSKIFVALQQQSKIPSKNTQASQAWKDFTSHIISFAEVKNRIQSSTQPSTLSFTCLFIDSSPEKVRKGESVIQVMESQKGKWYIVRGSSETKFEYNESTFYSVTCHLGKGDMIVLSSNKIDMSSDVVKKRDKKDMNQSAMHIAHELVQSSTEQTSFIVCKFL